MTRISDRALLWTTTAALIIGGLIALDIDANAQPMPMQQCAPLADLMKTLEKDFKEVEIAGGVVNEQSALLIFGKPDGSTWTAVNITPDGGACIVASGTGWFQSDLLKGQPV